MKDKPKSKKRIIVTSALPYANGPIHIGHLVEYIQSDIFVRFLKLTGKKAVYCCADDTHGTPIQISSEKEGIIPEELIGRFHKEHLRDFKRFLVSFDSYYSTNSDENKYFSDLIFQRLKKKGLIYKKDVELAYCSRCKRFLPDRYIKGKCPKCGAADQYGDVCEKCNAAYKTTDLIGPYCTICGKPPVKKISTHCFFKLSDFSDKLRSWFKNNKKLQPEIINYLNNWIEEGLQDWDISRDGPYFGFKMPGEENLYYYVWLDAPIGYISSFSTLMKNDVKKAEKEWNRSRIIHFIGKDITYFHFLFWPAMLMGAGLALPEDIIVHGFLTVNREKMSKSRGTFFTAEEFSSKYDPECLRFYYARSLSRKLSDIDLDLKDFKDSINNELVGNLGNFCYRVLSFANRFFSSRIKDIDKDEKLIKNIEKKAEKIRESYSKADYNRAVKDILAISDLGNKYFQKNEPWKLIKEDKEKARKVIGLCTNIAKNLSILISPILPEFSRKLQEQLNLESLGWKDINFSYNNREIGEAKILVDKIEEKAREKFPLSLKVAKIKKVDDHPEADRLYVLEVDIGEKRQIVAGIKKFYRKEELEGKNIIIVSNLKPAKLRGVISEGMLLAVEKGDGCKVLFAEGKPGEDAVFGDMENETSQVKFEVFSRLKMVVKDGKVVYNKKPLRVGKKDITVKIADNARVC
ncbi:methionine--tRNA ligase [Candidatus Woesearchaeota archaeon]|nr:methionine--tRNA ligase [Candidatus Woesearchaeota archaeon]